MPTAISTKLDVTRLLQYYGEGLLSTTSNFANKSNPTYANVGCNPVWALRYIPQSVEIRKIGTMIRDSKVKVFETGVLDLKTYINTAHGLNFAKWCFNAPNSTGTIDESVEFAWSYNVNGTEHFTRAQGCLPLSATLDIAEKGLVSLNARIFVAKPILPSTTSFIGSGAFAGSASGAPYTHSDGGSNPFTFNSVNYGTMGFSVTVDYDIVIDESSGDTNPIWAKCVNKSVSGSVDCFTKDILLLTDAKNQTSRTMSRVLKTGTSTISFEDVIIDEDKIDIPDSDSADPIITRLNYTAKQVTLS